MALVGIVMGSKSDAPLMQSALEALDKLSIPYEVRVLSAHRQPEKVREYAQGAAGRGIEVLIAGAGMAAHLPGVLAGWTPLPVIGVPLASGAIQGIDALLSIVQMPPGVPVACVGIGSARNAALLAAQMLGLKHEEIRAAFAQHRKEMAEA